jgi:SAM-dependent methyltransferase
MAALAPQPVILDSLDALVYRATNVLAGIELDLFTPLKNGPLTTAQIADAIGVEAARLRPLLYALVVVGLLTVEDERFGNTAEADHYLVRGRSDYWGHALRHWSPDIWSAALQTGASIRTGKPQAEHDYASMPEDELDEFLQCLYPWAYQGGLALAKNYDWSFCRSVLDAAGGSGALAIALAEALPHLHLTIAELPPVVPVARRCVERAGLAERVRVEAVDLRHQPPAGTFDAAILKSFIQTLSLDEARQALGNIHQALKPGSKIFVCDWPLDDSRLTPEDLVLFSPVFRAIYDHGQKYTVGEYKDLLVQAGFTDAELNDDRVITARKPK